MQDQYVVMGNPIAHSKSPFIHSQFAKQTGQDIVYRAQLVDKHNFSNAVAEFKLYGKGFNITVPFKEEAWQLVDERSEIAEKAGAVNTITIRAGGRLVGDNTDGVGIVRDLRQNNKVDLHGKRILILGAGGAVRGVLGPILKENPDAITIANRTVSKAQNLVELFSAQGNMQAVGFDQLTKNFDIIINGTAASLNGELPPVPAVCAQEAVCYDMMYSKEDTVFMEWAKKNQASKVIDGLGMLVEQAGESFFIWRGVRPNTSVVIDAVRKSFG